MSDLPTEKEAAPPAGPSDKSDKSDRSDKSDGSDRSDAPAAGEGAAAGAGAHPLPPPDFQHLVSGFAAEVLMHLGLMTHPLTEKTEVNLPHAGYTLDLLEMLREKTRGNLTEEEQKYLTAALYHLRLEYVRVARERKAEGGKDVQKG